MESFRRAEEGDLPVILNMYEKAVCALRQSGIEQWDEAYPDQILLSRDVKAQRMYVLTDGELIEAAVVINRQMDALYQAAAWTKGRFAVLHRLCVNPDIQNKGVGKKTVRYAEAMLARRGVRAVRLDAFTENPAALRLYEGLGYQRVGAVNFRKGEFILFEKLLA